MVQDSLQGLKKYKKSFLAIPTYHNYWKHKKTQVGGKK